MTDEQLNQYEQNLKQQADNAAQTRIGNIGNAYANYGSSSMTNSVNSFNYDRINDYMNALGKREELAQALGVERERQRSTEALQKRQLETESGREQKRMEFEERHFGKTQDMTQKQLNEQKRAAKEQAKLAREGRLSAETIAKENANLQKVLQTQSLAQSHNQFQQQMAQANEERKTRAEESAADRSHRESLHKDDILSREKTETARREEFNASLAHQAELARQGREATAAEHEKALEETKAARLQGQSQFETAQKDAKEKFTAEHAQRVAEALSSKTLAEQNLAFNKARFLREMEAKGIDRDMAERQFDIATENRLKEHTEEMTLRRQQHAYEKRFRGRQLKQADTHFLKGIEERAKQNLAELGFREKQHSDTIEESKANRTLARDQFEEQKRQAKVQGLRLRKLGLHSMLLANGQASHSQWLNEFNASLAHMGLHLKRDKLDMLMRGELRPPDENAADRDKISWMASLLSDADASAGAKEDRKFRAANAANEAAANRLSAEARLNQQSHAYNIGMYNNLMTPLIHAYGGIF